MLERSSDTLSICSTWLKSRCVCATSSALLPTSASAIFSSSVSSAVSPASVGTSGRDCGIAGWWVDREIGKMKRFSGKPEKVIKKRVRMDC